VDIFGFDGSTMTIWTLKTQKNAINIILQDNVQETGQLLNNVRKEQNKNW